MKISAFFCANDLFTTKLFRASVQTWHAMSQREKNLYEKLNNSPRHKMPQTIEHRMKIYLPHFEDLKQKQKLKLNYLLN